MENLTLRKIKNLLCTETLLLRSISFKAFSIVREQCKFVMCSFSSTTPFPFSSIPESHVTWPCFCEDIMKNVSTSSQYWRGNIENWTFYPFAPVACPKEIILGLYHRNQNKNVKTAFYQPSSFYLEMTITHSTKQPKFPRCRFLSMFRCLPSIIPRVYSKLKRMTGQLLETHERRRLELMRIISLTEHAKILRVYAFIYPFMETFFPYDVPKFENSFSKELWQEGRLVRLR